MALSDLTQPGECPKCGYTSATDITLTYCPGKISPKNSRTGYVDYTKGDNCPFSTDEHFHRVCGRCGYRWVELVEDAKEGDNPGG